MDATLTLGLYTPLPQWLEGTLIATLFLLSALLAPRVVRWCAAHGWVASVTQRSSHSAPTPLGVGVLLPLLVIPVVLVLLWFYPNPHQNFLLALLLASIPLAAIGWWDDGRGLTPWVRFVVQFAAVGVGLWFLPELFHEVPLWLEKGILLFAWVWFVNLYNFMDGIDGQALTQAAFLSLAVALLLPPLKILAIPLLAVSLGLLVVNWYPAKAFIGDVGATWLGYVLGGLLLIGATDATWANHTWDAAFVLLTLTLGFSADATYTLFKRMSGGHAFWVPHKEFWFHRFVALGYSHGQAVRRLMVMNALLAVCALIGWGLGLGWLGLLLGLFVFAIFCWRVVHLEG